MTDLKKDLYRWRQDLHRIPELGFQEEKTAIYLRNELDRMGLRWEAVCNTGTLVFFDLGHSSAIAFRADMDGLPVLEETSLPFASEHQGRMHACGHDGHMAILLGFSAWLTSHKDQVKQNILLVFQPAEEGPGGAQDLVGTDFIEKYGVQAIYGLHLFPELPEGLLATKPGPLMAQTGEIRITIQGKGAHAGLAYQGIDSLLIAAGLVQQYQNIITRQIPAMETVVLHIGELHAGEAVNVVAPKAELAGTIRTFSKERFFEVTHKMAALHQAAEVAYGCKIDFSVVPMYPPVLNDFELTKLLFKYWTDAEMIFSELPNPYLLAEDFSYYQEKVPGVFLFLGTRNEEKGYICGLHNSQFNFDESVLIKGVEAFAEIAKRS